MSPWLKNLFQTPTHFRSGRWTLVWIFTHQFKNQFVEFQWTGVCLFHGMRNRGTQMLLQDRGGMFTSIRSVTCQHFVKNTSHRIQVDTSRQSLPANLLWSHVLDRSHGTPRSRQAICCYDRSQTKITELQLARFGDQEIARLDITMDDAVFVGVLQGFTDLQAEVDDSFPGQFPFPTEKIGEGSPFDQFHRIESFRAFASSSEAPNDVRMVKLLQDIEFPFKSRQQDRVSGDVRWQQFDGNNPIIPRVSSTIHDSHAPLANFLEEFKWPDPSWFHESPD